MNIQQVNSAIMFGSWTDTELKSMIDAVKFARTGLQRTVKRTLQLGDTVMFTSTKTGGTVQGIVEKVAVKFVTVRTAQGLWRVPANMLSKV